MKRITLIDGNNWLRRLYSTEAEGATLRDATVQLRTELAMPETGVVIAWDGFNCNKYRRAIYPEYKTKRPDSPDAFHIQMKAFKRILDYMPVITVEIPEYEADDIVAALVRGFRETHPLAVIHVKSTDKDFNQLGVSYEGKVLGVEPKHTVLYKTLVGDTSDAISGIPGFGKKKWETLDKDLAQKWMDTDFNENLMPPFPDKIAEWCRQNKAQLKAMRNVCLFRPVSEELLTDHAKFGENNPNQVEAILKGVYGVTTKINQKRKARMQRLSVNELEAVAEGGTLSHAAAKYELRIRNRKNSVRPQAEA